MRPFKPSLNVTSPASEIRLLLFPSSLLGKPAAIPRKSAGLWGSLKSGAIGSRVYPRRAIWPVPERVNGLTINGIDKDRLSLQPLDTREPTAVGIIIGLVDKGRAFTRIGGKHRLVETVFSCHVQRHEWNPPHSRGLGN